MQTRQVRVLRAFYFNGAPTKVGDVIEVSAIFGTELIAAKKAEAFEPPAKAGSTGGDSNSTDGKESAPVGDDKTMKAASRDANGGKHAR